MYYTANQLVCTKYKYTSKFHIEIGPPSLPRQAKTLSEPHGA